MCVAPVLFMEEIGLRNWFGFVLLALGVVLFFSAAFHLYELIWEFSSGLTFWELVAGASFGAILVDSMLKR